MKLELKHRWEHALIGATVEAVGRHSPDSQLGRTAIQKLLYFMNVRGVPMKYNFDIHHYGPFCANVMHDVEWLLADEVIKDQSKQDRYSDYKPSSGWTELEHQFKEKLDRHREEIESVCKALSDLSPNTLELIATLDFSFRWVRARGGNGPWKAQSVEKFKSIKKDKFADRQIDEWYHVLVDAGLIEP